MMYVLLMIGFLLLIKGADFFVDGSSSIARILKVPSVVIGLTLVAMGTSAPEASVSITAGLAGSSDISLGNIVGSNIFNLLMVVGVSAVIIPVISHQDIIRRDFWWNIAATILLLFAMWDGTISRINGLVLIVAMVLYLFIVVRQAIKDRSSMEENTIPTMSVPKSIIFMITGLAAVIIGGNLVVDNATLIAHSWGMSNTLIGLTIVAIGTSLPELVTSIVAARKGESGIALGNAVGSCIFNILFILGIASTLSPIHVAPQLIIDTAILIGVSILIMVFARSGQKTNRWEGLICIALYVAYSAYIIAR